MYPVQPDQSEFSHLDTLRLHVQQTSGCIPSCLLFR